VTTDPAAVPSLGADPLYEDLLEAARAVVTDAWRGQYEPNYSIRPEPLRRLARAVGDIARAEADRG
jgi:hypothetical protein